MDCARCIAKPTRGFTRWPPRACSIGASLGLRPLEWTLLAIAATVVWVAEALNTALEALSDATVPEHSPHIAVAKDVAAGAVLLASLGAVAVGLLVFVPHLTARIGAFSW